MTLTLGAKPIKNCTPLSYFLPDDVYAWSRTRKGGWAIAQRPILVTTIILNRLRMLDLHFFSRTLLDNLSFVLTNRLYKGKIIPWNRINRAIFL